MKDWIETIIFLLEQDLEITRKAIDSVEVLKTELEQTGSEGIQLSDLEDVL